MLNRRTGALRLAAQEAELSPDLTRSAFLASPAGRGAEVVVSNEPYSSWRIAALADPGHPFVVVVYFVADRLSQVHLVESRHEFGTSWDDWSKAKERARKAAHDAWLDAELGSDRTFSWGTVESALDPHGGDAVIILTYR